MSAPPGFFTSGIASCVILAAAAAHAFGDPQDTMPDVAGEDKLLGAVFQFAGGKLGEPQ